MSKGALPVESRVSSLETAVEGLETVVGQLAKKVDQVLSAVAAGSRTQWGPMLGFAGLVLTGMTALVTVGSRGPLSDLARHDGALANLRAEQWANLREDHAREIAQVRSGCHQEIEEAQSLAKLEHFAGVNRDLIVREDLEREKLDGRVQREMRDLDSGFKAAVDESFRRVTESLDRLDQRMARSEARAELWIPRLARLETLAEIETPKGDSK